MAIDDPVANSVSDMISGGDACVGHIQVLLSFIKWFRIIKCSAHWDSFYVAFICQLDELTWVQLSSNYLLFLVLNLDQNLERSLEWI